MNRFLVISAVVFFAFAARESYSQGMTPPEFPGGKKAFSNFLSKNLKWPKGDTTSHGIVYLSFFIERDGALTHINVDNGLSKYFDAEALRVIRLSPRWISAMKNSRSIKSKYRLPIRFYLTSD